MHGKACISSRGIFGTKFWGFLFGSGILGRAFCGLGLEGLEVLVLRCRGPRDSGECYKFVKGRVWLKMWGSLEDFIRVLARVLQEL